MKKLLKDIIRKTLKIFNLQLSYYKNSRMNYLKAIESRGINLIFDVGANTGQFALSVFEDDYQGRIISFEPTSNVYKELTRNAEKFYNWKIHERVAVGETCGKVAINIAGNLALSSSVLKMGKLHEESAPDSKYIDIEDVKLVTIDSIFADYFIQSDKCLLKIDVQGYEEQVLNGALNSIKQVDAVKIECSLVSLYEGDKTFEHYFQFFEQNGFGLFDIEPAFSNPVTGRLLQFDALFVRH